MQYIKISCKALLRTLPNNKSNNSQICNTQKKFKYITKVHHCPENHQKLENFLYDHKKLNFNAN